MGKYDALGQHLVHGPDREVTMSFDEIEALIGGLPPSARDHRAWWGNTAAGHSHAAAWLNAGRRVIEVNLTAGRVRFSAAEPLSRAASPTVVRPPDVVPAPELPPRKVAWDDVWSAVAATIRGYVGAGLQHLLTEDVVRFGTIRALVDAGVDPRRISVERRQPEIAASLDLTIDTPSTAVVEFKYPRDPEGFGAADTMTLGELLRDFYRLAWIDLDDTWAFHVIEPRLRAFLDAGLSSSGAGRWGTS